MPEGSLSRLIGGLRQFYGPRDPVEPETWFEFILRENVAHLVDDVRRNATWRRLAAEVGLSPAVLHFG